MAAPPYSVIPASTSPKHSIDLKANGEVSRMRSHKGNMPSLPQTKYCSLCPAKFTRTTHLNRHLRSHTNERLHRCNICHAEFTRSDLLTRHKRTCGDSLNANRSRRKSCQACAESKVKCNLQYPCSKCSVRGRECVFINDPVTSRNKKFTSKKVSQCSPVPRSASENDTMPVSTGPISLSSPPSSVYSSGPNSAISSPSSHHSTYSVMQLSSMPGFEFPNVPSSSASSSSSSSHSSPRSDFFETQQDLSSSFDMNFDALALDTHLHRLFSNEMFEPFLDQSFSPCSPHAGDPGDFTWMGGHDFYPGFGSYETFPFTYPLDDQHFLEYSTTLTSNLVSPATSGLDLPTANSMVTDPSVINPSEALTADPHHYLYLFFSAFSTQVPLLHSSTWKMEGKPPILIRAMQACGALFVKTQTALNFIAETLASTRDILIQEFANNPTDSVQQTNLIIAVVLLQTIGLFHQRADQRVSSNFYHGMLVMMIRRTGLIGRVGSWMPSDLSNPNTLDAAWKEWANFETIKRALLLSYLHDCCHCMYFSLSPSFQSAEFEINLPCDDAIWKAGSAREWFETLQSPSPYGTGQARISGVGMQFALATLGEMRLPTLPLSLNPFGHLILIHTILRNLYASRAESQSLEGTFFAAEISRGDGGTNDIVLATQYALHNWLQTWLNAPESMGLGKNREEPPFVCDALPFYWLAQVSLLAIQEGTTIFAGTSAEAKPEGRFRVIKQWLDRIRSFVRTGDQMPTNVWDELVKIRLQISHDDLERDAGQQDGLLAFFPEH